MRIVVFTIENTEFVRPLLDPLIESRGHEIVSVFVSRAAYGWRFLRRRAGFMLRNRYPFCIRLDDWKRCVGASVNSWHNRDGSLVKTLRAKGISAHYIKEVRTERTREQLRALNADVFLFCPFNKIVGPKFLAIPRIGTYNLHLGKLPEYRGGFHAFWVLRFGDTQAGVTVHRVTEELDAGDIIIERRFPVRTNSMHDLMDDTIRTAAPMVVEALDRIEAEDWRPVETAGRSAAYYMLPTREDFLAFYERGCRLV